MTPDPTPAAGRQLRAVLGLAPAPGCAPSPARTLPLAPRSPVGTPDGPGRVAVVFVTLPRHRVFVVVDLDDGEQMTYAADEISAPGGRE